MLTLTKAFSLFFSSEKFLLQNLRFRENYETTVSGLFSTLSKLNHKKKRLHLWLAEAPLEMDFRSRFRRMMPHPDALCRFLFPSGFGLLGRRKKFLIISTYFLGPAL